MSRQMSSLNGNANLKILKCLIVSFFIPNRMNNYFN